MTSKGLRYRARGHGSHSKHSKMYFSKAIRKYGLDAFEFGILEACETISDALTRERELISSLKPEYNTAAGGKSGPQGWKHSDETRQKLSDSHKGKPSHWSGKKRSIESIEKRTATRALNPVRPWAGKRRSPETIAKIVLARKGKPSTYTPDERVMTVWLTNMQSANEDRFRAVYCTTDGKAFKNAQDCADHYGVSRSALGRWLRGEAVCQRGLKFEYVE